MNEEKRMGICEAEVKCRGVDRKLSEPRSQSELVLTFRHRASSI